MCRDQAEFGMSFGSPGVGKTAACRRYSSWPLIEANLSVRNGVPVDAQTLLSCDVLYYKPGITVSPARLKSELTVLKNRFHDAKTRAISWQNPQTWAAAHQSKQVNLIIVDEAHRLKYATFEELRDLQEKWSVGIVLIGDLGMERSLARMFHFSDRVRYIERFEPLSMQETVMYIDQRIDTMSVSKPPEEVYSLISDYCRGNPRKLGHLFALVERLLQINDDLVDGVTSEVVKTAREMMLLRAGRIETLGELANAV